MNHRLVIPLVALLVVLVPSAASAKGPRAVTVVGPGGDIVHVDSHQWRDGTPFVDLIDASHAMSAIFPGAPLVLDEIPDGELGPRYELQWDIGLRNRSEVAHIVRQYAYPFAEGGPVTFVPPGQPLHGDHTTQGGWFAASPALGDVMASLELASPLAAFGTLTDLGVPALPVTALAAVLAGLLAVSALGSRLAGR